jgi:hypothetical protein
VVWSLWGREKSFTPNRGLKSCRAVQVKFDTFGSSLGQQNDLVALLHFWYALGVRRRVWRYEGLEVTDDEPYN